MLADIKALYKSYLDGRTDIQTIDTYEGGRGLFLKENWDGSWSAMSNVGMDNWAVHSFGDKALAVGYLLGADKEQLAFLDSILKEAKNSGYLNERFLSEALLTCAPSSGAGSLMESNRALHADLLSGALKDGAGAYDPAHAIYIDSTIGSGDSPSITFHRIDFGEIEDCLQHGIDNFSDVPDFANSIAYRRPLVEIPVSGADDPKIGYLAATLAGDGRWCDVSVLDPAQLNRLKDVLTKSNDIMIDMLLLGEQGKDLSRPQSPEKNALPTESGRTDSNVPKVDEWRDGMVEQVSGLMDKVKDVDAVGANGADTVLAKMLESVGENSTDAVMDMLEVYSQSDTSGRSAIAEVFHALTGETFDYFLTQASDACEQTLCQFGEESLDDLMEQKVDVADGNELGEDLGVSNGER